MAGRDAWNQLGLIFAVLLWKIIQNICSGQDDLGLGMPGPLQLDSGGIEGTTEEPKCHEALGEWIPRIMEHANKCVADNPDAVDRMRLRSSNQSLPHFNCIMKCIGQGLGIIKEDGSLDQQAAVDFVEENVYESYKELAREIFAGCFLYTEGLTNSSDVNCYGHARVFKCISDAGPKVVKECARRLGIYRE